MRLALNRTVVVLKEETLHPDPKAWETLNRTVVVLKEHQLAGGREGGAALNRTVVVLKASPRPFGTAPMPLSIGTLWC